MTTSSLSVTAVVTTIDRPTLARTLKSIKENSIQPSKIIIKGGQGDTIKKMSEALTEVETDVLVWLDDDAVYPMHWLKSLVEQFSDPAVAYAAGTCLPLTLIDENSSSDLEKCIAEATSSRLGTTNASQRIKVGTKIEDMDETNLMGSGMYRTNVIKEIFNEPEKIPPAFSETYIISKMREKGYKTLYIPGGFFYHKQRSSYRSFAKQIFRSGVGRMNFFRQFPREATRKIYMLFPLAFLLYLPAAAILYVASGYSPIFISPILIYAATTIIYSILFAKHKSPILPIVFLLMHLSYGVGLLFGIRKSITTWK